MSIEIIKSLETAGIDAAGKLLSVPFPDQFWVDAKYFIVLIENKSNLTGTQKHDAVKAQLKLIFKADVGPFTLHVGEVIAEALLDAVVKCGFIFFKTHLAAISPQLADAIPSTLPGNNV
jgi:hypothetical protein